MKVSTAYGSAVIPLLSGGLHCGIKNGLAIHRAPEVIPLLSGGLHCGLENGQDK